MQRMLKILAVALVLAISSLACNLPFLASDPAATSAPTDAGFQIPTEAGNPTQAVDPAQATEPAAAGEPETLETPGSTGGGQGGDKEITLATTDELSKTGLLDALVGAFQQSTGYKVKLELGGTGRAFRLGEKYVADVLLVNNPGNEMTYMKAGNGRDRVRVMHADYVIVGPADDPAGVKSATSATEAFKKIAGAGAKFVSRGAESAVLGKEKHLWAAAGISPAGDWYFTATDAGMVGTLKLASDKKAYTLIDRVTFLENSANFGLVLLYEGSSELHDVYHVITGNPDKSPKINYPVAQAFVQFLTSPEAQQIISQFGADKYGQPIYFGDAGTPEN